MAIVSRFSSEIQAASVKHEVKKNLTRRLMERVGMGDSDSDTDSDTSTDSDTDGDGSVTGSTSGSVKKKGWKKSFRKRKSKKSVASDLEKGDSNHSQEKPHEEAEIDEGPSLPSSVWAKLLAPGREQAMPDDAVLAKEDAKDVSLVVLLYVCLQLINFLSPLSCYAVSMPTSNLWASLLWKTFWKVRIVNALGLLIVRLPLLQNLLARKSTMNSILKENPMSNLTHGLQLREQKLEAANVTAQVT